MLFLAWACSLAGNLIVTRLLIPFLHKLKFGQVIREEGPESHKVKSGIPTMGGIGFIVTPLAVLLVLNPKGYTNFNLIMVVLAFVGYGLVGFIDDFIIVVKKDNEGLKPRYKMLLQSVLAVTFFIMYRNVAPSTVSIPFTHWVLDLKWFYFVLVFVMFTGETNAVNLSDGLDGLSSVLVTCATIPFVYFAIRQNQFDVAMFLVSFLGALLAYLYYNHFPAKIMMGDTGSLAMGGVLASSAMVLKQEIALVIIGGVFVAEAVSVIIQVGYFKLTGGKRFFRMAPIHHHFELRGMKETEVVHMFWAIGAGLALLGILMGVTM